MPGEFLLMKKIPITQTMRQTTDNHLGFCILAANGRHVRAALLRCEDISHN